MADDAKKVAEKAKPKSFLDKVTGILNNPDLPKSLTALAEITGDAGMSQADKEKLVKQFMENDAKRVAAEKVMLDKLKANEEKIKGNEKLLEASRAAVAKLEGRIAEIDKRIADLDADFEKSKSEEQELAKKAADLKKKLGMD